MRNLLILLVIMVLGLWNAGPAEASGHPFKVVFAGFYGDPLFPLDRETLEDHCFDITSLLKKEKEDLLNLLRKARPESNVDKTFGIDLRVSVQSGRDKWLISLYGDVIHGKDRARLDPSQLKQLKQILYGALPPPEDGMMWRQETIADEKNRLHSSKG